MSNLLDKASIILTPTAYNNGEALCVKPSDGSGDFDFSRNSAATRVNAQGLVENVQILSSNLVQNGDFSNGSTDWTLQSEWSIGTNKAIYDNSSSGTLVQSFNWQVGKTYKITFDIGDFTTSQRFDIYSGVSFIKTAAVESDTSYTIYFNGDGGSTFRFRGLTTESFSITNISIIEITTDTSLPRINYEGFSFDGSGNVVPDSGCGSWLFEPQSTNLFLKSEPTSAEGLSIGVSYESFDWSIGFDNCVRYPNNSTLYLHYGGTCLASTSYTLSYYIKMDNGEQPIYGTDFSHRIGNVSGTSPILTNMGNGVYRVSETKISSTSNLTRSGVIKDTVNSAIGFRITALQLEQQSYATSYIPTEGSTVTRNQDLCINGGSLASINSTEGVFYAEIAALANDLNIEGISISDGSTSNRVVIFKWNSSNTIRARVSANGVNVLNQTISVTNITDFNKIAISYKLNDFKVYINGTNVFNDTSGATPIGLNTLSFSTDGTSSAPFFGKTKCLAVWKEALSDSELQSLTTI